MRIANQFLSAGVLAAVIAMPWAAVAEEVPETMAEAKEAFGLAEQWISGELEDYNAPEVTYTGEPITLRMSVHTPPVAGITKFAEASLKVLEKMSDGKIKYEFRPGGVVHNVTEGFEANRNAITDMSPCFTFYNPTNFPMTQALSLPGLFPNPAVMQRVIEDLYPKYFAKEFERQGVYALGLVGSATFRIFSNDPIVKLEDIDGKKVRSGGGLNQRIFQALGASTVNMSSRDFQQGMQRGLIDAVYTSDTAGLIFKLTNVAKHHTDVEINHTQLDWCMNRRWYDALPDDLKKVVSHWARAQFQAQTQLVFLRTSVVARNKFKEAGMIFHDLTPEEFDRWKKAYADVSEQFIKDMEAKGLPIRAMLDETKALVEKYDAMSFNELLKDAIENPNLSFYPGTM